MKRVLDSLTDLLIGAKIMNAIQTVRDTEQFPYGDDDVQEQEEVQEQDDEPKDEEA